MGKHTVLLINPPQIVLKKDLKAIDKLFLSNEPFGILSIASVLLENKIDCKFLDARAELFDIAETLEFIKKVDPGIIGIPVLTSDAFVTEELLLRIRKTFMDAIVVLGNLHASIFYEYYLKKDLCDFVAHGEAEFIMLNLCRAIFERKNLREVKGISFKLDNEILNTQRNDLIENLDVLPMPARNIAPMDKYRQKFNHGSNKKCIHMMSSRGCPVGCTFCCVHCGKKVRMRSAGKVLEEIDILVKEYGADEILFYDPMFLASRDRLFEICDGIKENFPRLKWKCEAHVNFINEKVLKKMKESGCTMLFFGIETGNDELLKVIGKKVTVEKIVEKVYLTQRHGIKIYGFFMLGIPGETTDMSYKTIELALSLPLEFAQFTILTPFPGSEMFTELRKQNKIDPYAWDRYYTFAGFTDKEPIYVPEGRTSDEINELQRKAIRSFHLRPKNILKQSLKIRPHNLIHALHALKTVVFSK